MKIEKLLNENSLEDELRDYFRDHYSSVFAALEDEEDWLERVMDLGFDEDDLENLYVADEDVATFRKMVDLRDTAKALKRYALDYDDWLNSSDADEVKTELGIEKSYRDEPYRTRGLSKRDFY